MRNLLAVLLLLFAGGAASAQAPEPPALRVDVRRDRDIWTAELTLPRAARAWVFARSPLTEHGSRPWRQPLWRVETPGARIERRGFFDILVGTDGRPVPRRVRIGFTPSRDRMAGDYDPSLVFSDGAVALYSRQFDAFPIDDVASVERLRPDGEQPASTARVTYRDSAGPVLAGGRRAPSVTVQSEGEGSYILFGPQAPVLTPDVALVVDPGLPVWLRTALADATPAMLARFTAALGPAPGPLPTIMVSWAGPTRGLSSMGGGALPGLIVMRFEGEGVLRENEAARRSTLQFIAHEAAHFWLGQAVRYDGARDGWITEGGADLLAFRAVAAADPGYDARAPLQAAINDCVRLAANRAVATANERNEHRAYYACGAVFALIAESASHRPFARFVRSLIDSNRRDGIVSRAEWLAELARVSRDPSLARDIDNMVEEGAADPGAAIGSLFTRAGVRFEPGPDGVPRLL